MKQAEKVLITGCGGMLGDAVYAIASKNFSSVLATDIVTNEPWLTYLDVRDIHAVEKTFQKFKPDIVIHLAALTDLEYCERHPQETWVTNGYATENMALLSEKYKALLVYIGTAGIFDDTKEEFTEFDTPNPSSQYAKAKYYGEVFIEQHVSRYYIFRAGWMMGGGPQKDKKFVNKIYKQIKNGTKELFVVSDKVGTPTYTSDFAKAIMKVIKSDYYGLYNQVCGGSCSRFDVAKEFVRLLGLSDKIKVTEVSSDYFKKEYFAPRPYSEKLVNLKLTLRNMNYMRDWRECLKEYSKTYLKDYHAKI